MMEPHSHKNVTETKRQATCPTKTNLSASPSPSPSSSSTSSSLSSASPTSSKFVVARNISSTNDLPVSVQSNYAVRHPRHNRSQSDQHLNSTSCERPSAGNDLSAHRRHNRHQHCRRICEDDLVSTVPHNMSSHTNGDDNAPANTSTTSTSSNLKKKNDTIGPRPHGSGFNSFLRWFKKKERVRQQATTTIATTPATVTATTTSPTSNGSAVVSGSSETLSPPASPVLGYFSQSSSCDSVFSTATNGFAFVSPAHYSEVNGTPEKRIAAGPVTDSYRRRLGLHKQYRERDRQFDWTLRKKYGIFAPDTANTAASSSVTPVEARPPPYSDRSLPHVRRVSTDDEENGDADEDDERETAGAYGGGPVQVRRHRRTASDSSKDKKAGAYVHVRGKRRAPPLPAVAPLSPTPSNTLSNNSTLGRKKRRAPLPPTSPTPHFDAGLLEDEDIKAIIDGISISSVDTTPSDMDTDRILSPKKAFMMTPSVPIPTPNPSRHLTEEQKQKLIDNIIRVQGTSDPNTPVGSASNIPTVVLANDTLKLERGLLRSIKDTGLVSADDGSDSSTNGGRGGVEIKPTAPLSPISPRPWYKRPLSSGTKSSAAGVPFKNEIILRTVDKRKGNKSTKESGGDTAPDVGYTRNSSSFLESASKLGLFMRDKGDSKRRDAEKRRSGIGIPNISELDREAAEIVHKEQVTQQAKLQADNDKYFQSPDEIVLRSHYLEQDGAALPAPVHPPDSPKSARELISQFEASSNVTRMTVNTSFIGRRENFFDGSVSTPLSPVSPLSMSATSTPPRSSIFSNIRFTHGPQRRQASLEERMAESPNSISATTSPVESPEKRCLLGLWTCSFCTLENPNWRIICGACERIKPYDKRITNFTPGDTAATQPVADTSTPTFSPTSPKPVDWEKKTERVMKYFAPKPSSGSVLAKSASETSVGKNSPFFRKQSPPTKLVGSPKLGFRSSAAMGTLPDKPDIIKDRIHSDQKLLTPIGESGEPEKAVATSELVDSNLVITTITTVFDAPVPGKHDAIRLDTTAIPDIDQMRTARLAKFDTALPPDAPEIVAEPVVVELREKKPDENVGKPTLATDRASLEREKERLRDMIRSMNARALAERYPVLQKSPSTEESTPPRSPIVSPKSQHSSKIPIMTPQNVERGKFGAIKKLFTAKKGEHEPMEKHELHLVEPPRLQKQKVSSSAQTEAIAKRQPDVVETTRPLPLPPLSPLSPFSSYSPFSPFSPVSSPPPFIEPTDSHQLKHQKPINTFQLMASNDFADIGAVKNSLNSTRPHPIDEHEPNAKVSNLMADNDQHFTDLVRENMNKISEQLQSRKGLEDFKATLRATPKSNTLAINKILRNLEHAISEGEFELAAQLAQDLARMKVSLSVTRQRYRPASGIDYDKEQIIVDMYVEDKTSHKGPIQLSVWPSMTVLELKQKVMADFEIPIGVQRWILNDELAADEARSLFDYGVKNSASVVYLYLVTPALLNDTGTRASNLRKADTTLEIVEDSQQTVDVMRQRQRQTHFMPHTEHSDGGDGDGDGDEDGDGDGDGDDNQNNASVCDSEEETSDIQNDRVGNDTEDDNEGATALTARPNITLHLHESPTSKQDGWTCNLCTLINSPNRPGCVACSEARPAHYTTTSDHEFTVPDELKRFLQEENAPKSADDIRLRVNDNKNDLNKSTTNRKSSEIFNIIVDEVQPNETTEHVHVPKPVATVNATPAPDVRPQIVPQNNNLVMMALLSSPNVAHVPKVRYRGVENFKIPSVFDHKPGVASAAATQQKATGNSPLVLQPPKAVAPSKVAPPLKIMVRTAKAPAPKPPTDHRNSAHYLELLNLDNTEVVPNLDRFECPICFVECAERSGVVLRDCLHSFCKECLVHTVQYSEEAEVKCPYADTVYSCESTLQQREIKAIVSVDQYEQHLAKSVRVAEHRIENAFHCKTPNCRGWCIFEDNVNQFRCPVCRIMNCLTCQVIHDGLNCKQYQDRMNSDCDSNADARRTKEMLQEMVDKGEALSCPTCQVVMMKKWGCDWLRCSMCKTEICWVTRGLRWGPGGKGDTSGGCKCGVNGVKCHPKCNYCH